MDRLPTDPHKLLEYWMEWEKGEQTPGRVLANLKIGGMREVLEELAAATATPATEASPPGP